MACRRNSCDLEKLTCVTFAGLGEGQSWRFASSGRMQERQFRPTCRLNINTAEAAIDAALAGIGVTTFSLTKLPHK